MPGYRDMGKLNELRPPRMPPKFLEQYLTYAPTPKYELVGKLTKLVWGDDPYQYHAYQGAWFLDFLARRAIEEMNATGAHIPPADAPLNEADYFARLFRAVATAGLETMPALDDFLTREHGIAKNLAGRYGEFVLHYLFAPASPMPPDATDPAQVNAAALDHASVIPLDSPPFTHTFDLVGGHSAKVWEVRAPTVTGQTRELEVAIDGDLPGYVTVHVVRLPQGRRRAGLTPEATFDHGPARLRAAKVTIDGDDRLYLVAINDWRFGQSVSLRVSEPRTVFEQATLELRLEGPADVRWGDGRTEVGRWSIDLATRERPVTMRDRVIEHEVHVDKPRDEKTDLSLSARPDASFSTMIVDLVIERTFESWDATDEDPQVTGGGKQRCAIRGITLHHQGTRDDLDGRKRWSYKGTLPPATTVDCAHTSHRSATRRQSGDPVPAMSFTKAYAGFTSGSLTLELLARPPVTP